MDAIMLTRHISHPPRLDQMLRRTCQREEHEHPRRRDIRPTEERLFASHPGDGGDDDGFGAAEHADGVIYRSSRGGISD